MSNTKIQNNLPGEWKIIRASEVMDIRDGTHATPKKSDTGIPLITSKNLINGVICFSNHYLISDGGAREINKRSGVAKGDILISMIGTVGESAIISNEPNFVIKNVGLFKANESKIKSSYLINQLHSIYLKNRIQSLSSGGIQKFISLGQLRRLPIILPPLSEQDRIVSVLETWDKAIELLARKIEVKKRIKKGLMQRLLTGKLRVPGFSEKWEVNKLGALCDYQNGAALEKYFNNEHGLKVISIGNYSESGKFVETSSYIDRKYLKELNVVKFVLNKNDLTMILNDKTSVGNIIGKVLFIESNDEYIFNQRTMRIIAREGIEPIFLYYQINSAETHRLIVDLAQPGTQIYLNTKDVLGLPIKYPRNKSEQIALVNLFMTTDQEIKDLELKLNKIKDQKKYLLNNLITGTIRTPETLTINV